MQEVTVPGAEKNLCTDEIKNSNKMKKKRNLILTFENKEIH